MGKRSRAESSRVSVVAGQFPIDSGHCELIRDESGWMLTINGVESSHINDDPLLLDFEYMRWFAELVDERGGAPRVLHLGAAGCSMARYVAARHPDARQVAVEIDSALATFVREWFDLPRSPLLRIRVGDAREVVESLTANTRDVVLRDVFDGIFTPRRMTTLEFVRQVRRVLTPGGLYVINCGDTRDLKVARSEATAIGDTFRHLAVIADSAMLKGRRRGNIVIAGSDRPIGESSAIARNLLGGSTPARLLIDDEAAAFAAAGKAAHDADLDEPGRHRLRPV